MFKTFTIGLLFSFGCAHGLDGARQALTNAEIIQAQAINSLEHYDKTAQDQIVAQYKSVGDKFGGQKALADYRNKRSAVVKAVIQAASVTSIGAVLIPLVERGIKKDSDLAGWLTDLFTATGAVRKTLADFGAVIK